VQEDSSDGQHNRSFSNDGLPPKLQHFLFFDDDGFSLAGRPLEERLEIQALSVDLREAVMACLSGGESRRWTIAELLERFKNLGICASRASVTAALAELGLELELQCQVII
jgi:hypothetical protein